MTRKSKAMIRKTSEEEIDQVVETQADDDSAWEDPIRVARDEVASLCVPAEFVTRASFLAKLHGESGAEEWLTRIIRERLEIEESAFAEIKRELKEKQGLSDRGVKQTAEHT